MAKYIIHQIIYNSNKTDVWQILICINIRHFCYNKHASYHTEECNTPKITQNPKIKLMHNYY